MLYWTRAAVLLVLLLFPLVGCTIAIQKERIAFVPVGSSGPDGDTDIHDQFVLVFSSGQDLEALADREGYMLGMDMEVECQNGGREIYAGNVRRMRVTSAQEAKDPKRWRYIGYLRVFDDISTERMLRSDYRQVVFRVRICYMFGGGLYSFTPVCVTRDELVSLIVLANQSRS